MLGTRQNSSRYSFVWTATEQHNQEDTGLTLKALHSKAPAVWTSVLPREQVAIAPAQAMGSNLPHELSAATPWFLFR